MFTPKQKLATAAVLLAAAVPALTAQSRYGFGTKPSEVELHAVDIAVGAKGEGLPPGQGTPAEGEKVYVAKCQGCHGRDGGGGPYDQLVGGQKPVKTIGSYWPYATTVFDYTRRAMPFNKPGSLSDAEVYAVTAWILWKNNIIAENTVIDKTSLPKVQMPNRNGFISDPRPEFPTRKANKKQ